MPDTADPASAVRPIRPARPARATAAGPAALPAGTYDGSVVFVTGGGTGLGRAIATEFARLGADLVIASRKPEHLDAGRAAIEALGARWPVVACDIREPDQIAAAFDAADERLRPARRAGQQRGGQLPGAGRGHVAQRLAHRRRHHAQRHVLLLPRVRPPPPRRRHPRLDHQRRRLLRLDRRPRLRPLGRGQGRRQEHGRDPGRRVGARTASRSTGWCRACSPTRT